MPKRDRIRPSLSPHGANALVARDRPEMKKTEREMFALSAIENRQGKGLTRTDGGVQVTSE